LEQLNLIWPCVPVFGAMLPMFTMAVAKALPNAAGFDAKLLTVLSVLPPLNSTWSE
jgi:NADH:ubiquinone oxidoreductase subunit 4 (subunit M)